MNLQRLPLTIPELVHVSPTQGSNGLLYAGDFLSYIRVVWQNFIACLRGEVGKYTYSVFL